MLIQVRGGTASGAIHLCDSCAHCHRLVMGGKETYRCTEGEPFVVRDKVSACSSHKAGNEQLADIRYRSQAWCLNRAPDGKMVWRDSDYNVINVSKLRPKPNAKLTRKRGHRAGGGR